MQNYFWIRKVAETDTMMKSCQEINFKKDVIVAVGSTLLKSYSSSFDTFPAHCTCKSPVCITIEELQHAALPKTVLFIDTLSYRGRKRQPRPGDQMAMNENRKRRHHCYSLTRMHCAAVNNAMFECSAERVQRVWPGCCTVWTGSSQSGVYIFKVALWSDNSWQNKGQLDNTSCKWWTRTQK